MAAHAEHATDVIEDVSVSLPIFLSLAGFTAGWVDAVVGADTLIKPSVGRSRATRLGRQSMPRCEASSSVPPYSVTGT